MALGFCMCCAELMTIVPQGQKWGSREINWAPGHHTMTVHRGTDDQPCGKRVYEFDVEGTSRYECVECGTVFQLDVTHEKCPGSHVVIR